LVALTALALASWLWIDSRRSNARTVDQVLKEQGLPLFAAKEARVDDKRWTLWAGFWPTRAGRLVTAGFHPIETKEQARKLSGEVLIYCSEPLELRGWGDLALWAYWVGIEMARSNPFRGMEGPNAKLLRVGPDPNAMSLPLRNPMKVTLVFLDRRGCVRQIERHAIIELATAPLRKARRGNSR
jgi:hypothetical protein